MKTSKLFSWGNKSRRYSVVDLKWLCFHFIIRTYVWISASLLLCFSRTIKRDLPSLKWNWLLPILKTWTAGALKSTHPSRTSGTCAQHLCICIRMSVCEYHSAKTSVMYDVSFYVYAHEERGKRAVCVWSHSFFLNTHSISFSCFFSII